MPAPHGEPGQTATRAPALDAAALAALRQRIEGWALEQGFDALGISDVDLSDAEPGLLAWLDAGFHGQMDYMAKHGLKRARPAELVPGTVRVISVRLSYLPEATLQAEPSDAPAAAPAAARRADWREREWRRVGTPQAAVVSLYARGRDYHKVLRQRLQRLAERIGEVIGPFGHRVFVDSAPVMEVELARRAGLGWRGKHTLLIHRDAGSFFFLGELFVDLPLPVDTVPGTGAPSLPSALARRERTVPAARPQDGEHCGQCRRCLDACPTGAIVAPFTLDARRCISYLTIEHRGTLPLELRALIGNRIYGCDDCQLVCPWNKFAQASGVDDFAVRNGLDQASLLELFAWSEADFETRTAGSAMRRIGHEQWQRNIAVALGNALRAWHGAATETRAAHASQRDAIVAALRARLTQASALLREHIEWALAQDAAAPV